MTKKLTYTEAGVDIDEGGRLVDNIKAAVRSTYRKEVIGDIGGFGALFSGRFKALKDPVLVSSTDGVGTKLKVAFMADRHSTVGIDLVAMCVNDVVTTGARPLFFLDYFAAARLDVKKAASVIGGIARGCKEAGCALVGGETAEMPGIYGPGEYDLAGFAVGVVDRAKLIDGRHITRGDSIIGLESSGLHSNGYSLARKLFFEKLKLKVTDRPLGFKKSVGAELLTPTRIYVKAALEASRLFRVKGIAHITGGGLTENIPRVLKPGVKAIIYKGAWARPAIFRYIQSRGNVPEAEMLRTFNCGIGLVMVVKNRDEAGIIKKLESIGERPRPIGVIEKRKAAEGAVEFRE